MKHDANAVDGNVAPSLAVDLHQDRFFVGFLGKNMSHEIAIDSNDVPLVRDRLPHDDIASSISAETGTRAPMVPILSLISVIVPVYNVAEYLDECLSSILNQVGVDLEILVINDGSTDGSGQIADKFAERDARVRVVHQRNCGLSASRNHGLREAKGVYLAFLDSDDYLLPGAYLAMLTSIMSNHADFVTANVYRLTKGKLSQSGLHRHAIQEDVSASHIRRNPLLIWDTVVWNKLYRMDFFREKVGDFEMMLYEDMFPMCKAHLLANHVNVLSQHVCVWRSREDNSSITQDRGSPGPFIDRLDATSAIWDYLNAHAPHLRLHFEAKQLSNDLFLYFSSIPAAGERFRDIFSNRVRSFVSGFLPESFAALSQPAKLVYALLKLGRINDIEKMLPFCGRQPKSYATTCEAGRFMAELPFRSGWNRLAAPDYDVTDQLHFEVRVNNVELTEAGCRVTVCARVESLSAPLLDECDVRIVMVDANGAERLPIHVVRQPGAALTVGLEGPSLLLGFDVDFIQLAQARTKPSRLRHFVMEIRVGQLHRSGVIAIDPTLPARWRTRQFGEWVIRPQQSETTLQIWSAGIKSLLLGAEQSSADTVDFMLHVRAGIIPSVLRFFYPYNGVTVAEIPVRQEGEATICTVPVSRLIACEDDVNRSISVSLVDARGKTSRVWCGRRMALPKLLEFSGRLVELKHSSSGNINLKVRGDTLRIACVAVRDGRMMVKGTTKGLADRGRINLVLRDIETGADFPLNAHAFDDEFEATINLVYVERSPGCFGPMPLGTYQLVFSKAHEGARLEIFDLGGEIKEPKSWSSGLELTLHVVDEVVKLHIWNRLGQNESGPINQAQLRATVYAAARSAPIEPLVLFDSWNGKRVDDSPLAIYREMQAQHLGLDLRFATANAAVYVPPGVKVVRKWSAAYWKMLGTARLVIVNDRLPQAYIARQGQKVLQTWHGTPLKKIGHDIANPQFDAGYLKSLEQEVPKWTLLMSPNPTSTARLRSAFRFKGDVIETGYPRNDGLLDAARAAVRERVRALLGIAPDEFCILYAPTWRDTQKLKPGKYAWDLIPDLDLIQKSVPSSHLIFRAHHLMVANTGDHANEKVQNVSDFPDIAHLYLAADVLISDYSSVIVDYSITGKPILLYAPDLKEYTEQVRGFYGDFVEEVPAPVLNCQEELVAALLQTKAGMIEETYRQRYMFWRAKFCALDDGHAARRVVECVRPFLK